MKLNKDERKVLGATTIALTILLVSASVWQFRSLSHRLQSDSAVQLAEESYKIEKVELKQRAQQLGSSISPSSTPFQWKHLRSRMQELGATIQTSENITNVAATSKHSIQGRVFLSKEQLWPLSVDSGHIKQQKVWIVHLGYWEPNLPPRHGWCGTGDDGFRQLAYLTYIIDDKPPHRCWVTSFTHEELLTPEERKQFNKDE